MSFTPMPLDPIQGADQSVGGLSIASIGPVKIGSDLYAWGLPSQVPHNLAVFPFSGGVPFGMNVYRSQDKGMTWHSIDGDNAKQFTVCEPHVKSDRLVIAKGMNQGVPISLVDFRFSNAVTGPNTFSTPYGTSGGPTVSGSLKVIVLSNGDVVVVYDAGSNVVKWARFSGGSWTTINNTVAATSTFLSACVDSSDLIHIIVQDTGTSARNYYRWTAGVITGPVTFPGSTDFLANGNCVVIGGDLYVACWGHGASPTQRPGVLIGSQAGSFSSFTLEEADTAANADAQFAWVWEESSKPNLIWVASNGSTPAFFDQSLFRSTRNGSWSAKTEVYNAGLNPPYSPLYNTDSPQLTFVNATPEGYFVELNVQFHGFKQVAEFFLFQPATPAATVNIALGGSGAGV